MAKIRLGNVINRWRDGSFFAYNGPLPPADTIDGIHRRIRDQGAFDKNDLNGIVSHYTTIDPKGVRENADTLNRLYRKLDAIGEFSNLVPRPNSDYLDEGGGGHEGTEWYDPNLIYGSVTTNGIDLGKGYVYLHRYINENGNTGYEIEFEDDNEYPYIIFSDVPETP